MFFVEDPESAATWWSSQLAGGETIVGDAGCAVHRAPLAINASRRTCQMVDPFGNTFGLDGP